MVGEQVEKKLYNVISTGDLRTLQQLLEQDPYLIHVSFPSSRNLLHIATMHEQVQIAQFLLSRAPEMCWWRDDQGLNPVHVAAINGHVDVIKLLLHESPLPAAERVHRGQTVLHLCVKHRQLMALTVLVDKLGELVCAKDDDGETVLHLAVRCNQLKTIRYLVENKKLEKQTRNSMGKTALQILNESPLQTTSYSEIRAILTHLSNESFFEALPKTTDVTMVVVVLIATMAFTSAISPPGGVWQETKNGHTAGEAVLASTNPRLYSHLIRANTTAFVASLITIFLITTGLPLTNFFFMAGAVYSMWVSLTAIAISYGISALVISNDTDRQRLGNTIMTVVAVVGNFIGVVASYFVVRGMYLSWRAKKRQLQDLTKECAIRRGIYWIFQQLETRGYLRADC